jgi:hypothetical protein
MTGQLTIGIAGGTDYLTYYNTNYTVNDYINQRFLFGNPSGTNRSAYIQATLTTGDKTNILFYTQSGGVGERMRITGDGNVGIGTNAPGVKLHVVGNTSLDGQCNISGNNVLEFASALTKEINAGKIGYGWVTANSLDIVGGGTTAGTRQVICYDRLGVGIAPTESFQTSGNARFGGNIGVGTEPSGSRFLRVTRAITADSDWSEMISFENSAVGTAYTHWEAGANVFSGKSRFTIRGGTKNFNTLLNYFNLDSDGVATFLGLLGVSGGNAYAIPNNHMTSGSLTIGDMTLNYGGGTNWNANTAGFMMECLDNTEIAVHDAGNRVTSLMYFQGGAVNTITIGRDMFWGLTPLIVAGRLQCNGSVGIGTTIPTGELDIYNTTAGYNNGLVVRTGNGAGIMLDASQTSGGRKYALLSSITGYGIGAGAFGIYDETGARYRLSINSVGNIAIGDASTGQHELPLSKFTINANYSAGESGGFCINATDNSVYNLRLYPYVQAGSQVAYQFRVNNVASSVNAMAIGHNGDIGIGNIVNPLSSLDINRSPARTGTHGSGLGLYVTNGGNTIAEFRDPNGTQGIGIGYNQIYTVGTNTNQGINILPRGTGIVEVFGDQKITRTASGELLTLLNTDFSVNAYINLHFNHNNSRSAYVQSFLPGGNRCFLRFYTGNASGGAPMVVELQDSAIFHKVETYLEGTPIVGSTRTPTYRLSLDNFSTTGRAIWAPLQHLPL